MRKRNSAILAAAVLAAIPVASKAGVILTFSIDPVITYGTAGGSIAGTVTDDTSGTAADTFNTLTNTLYLTAGQAFLYGYDTNFTPGTSAAGLAGTGLFSAAMGVTNSAPSIGQFAPGGNPANTAVILGGTNKPGVGTDSGASVLAPIKSNGAGGVSTNGPLNTTGPATTPQNVSATFAANSTVLTLSNIEVDTTSTAGSFILTPSTSGLKTSDAYAYSNSGAPSQHAFGTADTVTSTGAVLTVVTTGGSVVTPIVSLTSAQPGGTSLGSLTLVGNNGSYGVATTSFTATATGFVSVSGFNPTNDQEIYALKIGANPNNLSDSVIAADIQALLTTNGNSGGFTASAVANSAFSSIFSGYDVLLTGPAVSPVPDTSYLGFDLTQSAPLAGITVTGIAAVPEPATAAGVVLGAAGLLLGRRRKVLLA